MRPMQSIEPVVGDWYRSRGQLFEVVAIDESAGAIEIQHADGDLEEIEVDDWSTRCRAGALDPAEAPDDSRLAIDREDDDDAGRGRQLVDELGGTHAEVLEDLDLFDYNA